MEPAEIGEGTILCCFKCLLGNVLYGFLSYPPVDDREGKPRVLHDFDTPRVEWPYIQWQPMKESYILFLPNHKG